MKRVISAIVAGTACALLAGCGSSAAPTTTIRPSSSLPAGYRLYAVHRGLVVAAPTAWRPVVTRAPSGRISAGWVEPQNGSFNIDATWDPQPASLAAATAAAEKGPTLGAKSQVKVHVSHVSMPGAAAARLVTSQTAHGPHGLPVQTAVLIADEHGGAQAEVQVIGEGSAHPDPMSVIRTVRLTG